MHSCGVARGKARNGMARLWYREPSLRAVTAHAVRADAATEANELRQRGTPQPLLPCFTGKVDAI